MDQLLSAVATLVIEQGAFALLLALVVISGIKKYWRFGYQFDEKEAEMERDRQEHKLELARMETQHIRELATATSNWVAWKQVAEKALGHADKLMPGTLTQEREKS